MYNFIYIGIYFYTNNKYKLVALLKINSKLRFENFENNNTIWKIKILFIKPNEIHKNEKLSKLLKLFKGWVLKA